MTYHTTKRDGSRFRFFGDVIAELKKVNWLSKREAAYLTILILIVTAIVGVILGALDYGFTGFVSKFFIG